MVTLLAKNMCLKCIHLDPTFWLKYRKIKISPSCVIFTLKHTICVELRTLYLPVPKVYKRVFLFVSLAGQEKNPVQFGNKMTINIILNKILLYVNRYINKVYIHII